MRRRLVAVDRPADYVLLAVTLAEPGQRLGEVAVNKGPLPALEPLRGRAHEVLDAENGILPPLFGNRSLNACSTSAGVAWLCSFWSARLGSAFGVSRVR